MKKTLEPITWKTCRPDSFPCMICGEREAEWFYRYSPWNLPVCGECAKKSWEEIKQTILRREG